MFLTGFLVGCAVTFIMVVLMSALKISHDADEREERMLESEKNEYAKEFGGSEN